ncbi:MAG: 3-deoxy-D-manno-octulosonic acid transferase [Syntrophotaleaceae bacterium]
MYLLYNILLYLVALPLLPLHMLILLLRGKPRQGIGERFGFLPKERFAALQGKKIIWIHAVSVGETRAVVPLLKALKKRFPDYALILSNVTETGSRVAASLAEIDLCFFFPYDFPFSVKQVLRRIKPAMVVVVETEIWPNFLRAAGRQGVPVALVNGRISDRSFPRYRKLQFFLEPILQQFSLLGMQSPLDAERVVAMGAPPERVTVTRNLKFDMQTGGLEEIQPDAIREEFRLARDCRLWVAASTHAGEEEQVLDVFRRLLDGGFDLLLVLVPRHPERCRAVAELLSARRIPFVRRSEIEQTVEPLSGGMVLLVDSIGEVLKFYAVADLVFVGGSLVPVGGHNVLEASLLRKPVLFGPHMHNFKEISRLLIEAGGGISVVDADELHDRAAELLADPEAGRALGLRGYKLLEENRGATDHALKAMEGLLEQR